MGKITVEIEIKTFGTPLYGLSHPNGSPIRINIFSVSNFLSTENFKKILICNESNMAVQLELTYSP